VEDGAEPNRAVINFAGRHSKQVSARRSENLFRNSKLEAPDVPGFRYLKEKPCRATGLFDSQEKMQA